MDFTIETYKKLLSALQRAGFSFYTFEQFFRAGDALPQKVVVLRHDVDARNQNSLMFARIQHSLGIRGTYYFRMIPSSFDEFVIREMAEMGHEIGYHYENMDTCRGDVDAAFSDFRVQLENFRKLVPVRTVCMHGSPLSKFDNREIFRKYDYRELGIIAEPYFDLNWEKIFYLTDTGRRWNGSKVSIRDKPYLLNSGARLDRWPEYASTSDILSAINTGTFPLQLMLTFHPQRWTDNKFLWLQELVLQTAKNLVKAVIVRKSGQR